jgi:hypothetical protein
MLLVGTIHFPEKLPHGPYAEVVSQTAYTIYVHPDATVNDATDALCKLANETIDTQSKNSPMINVAGKFEAVEVKCKGGVVPGDTVLNTILSDGENLQINFKQDLAISYKCCVLF